MKTDSLYQYFAFLGPQVADEIATFFVRHGCHSYARKKALLHAQCEKSLQYVTSGIVGSIVVNDNLPKSSLLNISMPGFVSNGKLFMNENVIFAPAFAITDCEFYKIEVNQMEKILKDDHNLYRKMVKFFGRDMSCRMEKLFIMLTLSAEMRLRIFLRSLVLCTGQSEDAEWLTIPKGITREQYTMCIYISINTLDTILKKWKNLGVFKKIGADHCIHRRLIENVYHPANNFTDRLRNEDWK